MDRVIALYEVLSSYAHNNEERAIVASYLKELRREFGTNNAKIEGALVGAIFEGIHYGNWIWILRGPSYGR